MTDEELRAIEQCMRDFFGLPNYGAYKGLGVYDPYKTARFLEGLKTKLPELIAEVRWLHAELKRVAMFLALHQFPGYDLEHAEGIAPNYTVDTREAKHGNPHP